MKDELLKLAYELAEAPDANEIRLRQAISTAYYAAFHCLCELVASSLVADRGSPLFVVVYRSLEHSALQDKDLFAFDREVDGVRTQLSNLRTQRHEADYSPNSLGIGIDQTRDWLNTARDAIDLMGDWDADTCRELAVRLLLGKSKYTRLARQT